MSQELNLSMLEDKFSEIAELDARLDAGTGRGHIALGNEIVATTQDVWGDFAQQVLDKVDELSEDEQIGLIIHLDKAFASLRRDRVNDVLKERAETSDAEPIADSERDELFETRKELVNQFNAIKTLLETFNTEVPEYLSVRHKSGTTGTRGPNVVSQFQYAIDGENLSKDNNSLAYVMKNYTDFSKTKELKEYIHETAGVLLKKGEVPNSWSVALPNGKSLSATRFDEFLVTNEDELDDDENNDENE